jgi:hypothetical protein
MNKQQALNTLMNWSSRLVPTLNVKPFVEECAFSIFLNSGAVGIPETNFQRYNGSQFFTVNSFDPGIANQKKSVFIGSIQASAIIFNVGGAGSFVELGLIGLGIQSGPAFSYTSPRFFRSSVVDTVVYEGSGIHIFTDAYLLTNNATSGTTTSQAVVNFVGFTASI